MTLSQQFTAAQLAPQETLSHLRDFPTYWLTIAAFFQSRIQMPVSSLLMLNNKIYSKIDAVHVHFSLLNSCCRLFYAAALCARSVKLESVLRRGNFLTSDEP